jgi:hypothetical protein
MSEGCPFLLTQVTNHALRLLPPFPPNSVLIISDDAIMTPMLRRCVGGFSANLKKWGRFPTLACFVGVIFFSITLPVLAWAIEIDPELEELFVANETAGYVIYFRAKANLSDAPKTDWKEQNEFINRALQENANRSQARVRSYLFSHRVPYRSVWKENTIIVDRSDRDTFEDLKSFSEIESIKSYKVESKDLRKVDPVETKGNIPATNKP